MKRIFPVLLIFAAFGCGGSGDSTAPPVPTLVRISSNVSSISAGGTAQFTASVIDNHGAAMQGQTVAYSTSSVILGSVSSSGLFTSLGPTGTATVTASSGNLTASANLTIGVGAPASVSAASGTNQTGFVSSALRAPLAVVVRDAFANGVPGVIVNFAITGGNGALGSPSATTDALGVAQTVWTLGPSAGANSATATVGGFAPVTFSATATTP